MPDRTAGVEVTRNLLTAPVGDGDAGQLAPAHADPDAEVGPVVDGALARAYGYPGWLRPDWAGPGALAACNQDGQHGQQREWRQARKPLRHCGDTPPQLWSHFPACSTSPRPRPISFPQERQD